MKPKRRERTDTVATIKVANRESSRSEKLQMKVVKAKQNRQLRSGSSPRARTNTTVAPESPKPKRLKVPRIDKSLNVCLRELGRVYKQLRRGEIRPELGRQLVKTIQAVADILQRREHGEELRRAIEEWQKARQEAGLPGLPSSWPNAALLPGGQQ